VTTSDKPGQTYCIGKKMPTAYEGFITRILWAVRLSWLENAYSHPIFMAAISTHKVTRTDLVFGV